MKARRLALILGCVLVQGSSLLSASPAEQGLFYYKQGKYPEAISAFESALMEPAGRADRRTLYLYLGKSYESDGRLDKAIAAYEEAVAYDKKNWRRHRDLGGLYEQVNLHWKALASYKKGVKLAPKESDLFLAMGRVWRKLGLYSDAMPWLERALAAQPANMAVQQEISFVLEGQGRFLDAAVASAKSGEPGVRLLYLAALSRDPDLIKSGRGQLARSGVAKETRQAYENLVQLLQLPPKEILAGQASNPTLRAVLKTPFDQGTE